MTLIVKNKLNKDINTEDWRNYDANIKILLRSLDDRLYQTGLARARRQVERADARFKIGEVGVVDGEITEHDYQCKLLSLYVVQGWTGVKDEEGNEVAYSPEIAEKLLADNIDFFVFVIKHASEIAIDSKEEVEDSMGKSLSDSDGS